MNKYWYRVRIAKFERDFIIGAYDQILNKKNKQKFLNGMKEQLARFSHRLGLTWEEQDMIWQELYHNYLVAIRKTALVKDKTVVAEVVLDNMARIKMQAILNKIEARKNELYLKELYTGTPIFFLCSKHGNCAAGHLDAQGKIFVKDNWREEVVDEKELKRISSYINNHHIDTIGYITHAPTWLILRPNCRHELIPISTEEVLHASAKSLLNKYNRDFAKEYELAKITNKRIQKKLLAGIEQVNTRAKIKHPASSGKRNKKR